MDESEKKDKRFECCVVWLGSIRRCFGVGIRCLGGGGGGEGVAPQQEMGSIGRASVSSSALDTSETVVFV